MKNKIVAIIFVICILVMGGKTALNSGSSLVSDIRDASYNEVPAAVEANLSDHIAMRYRWINLNGMFQKIINKRVVENTEKDVYRASNGMLIGYNDFISDTKIAEYGDGISNLRDSINGSCPLVYIQLPYKEKPGDSITPPGVNNYANSNADRLLDELRKDRIATLDLRQEILDSDLDWYSLFFNTDHHWKPSTALWAAGRINRYLSENQGWNYSSRHYDIGNYNVKTYKDWFLGAQGKRIGNLYSGVDDFDVITPKFDTDYTFTASSRKGTIERKGDFSQALLYKKNLRKDYFDISTYYTYIGGDFKTSHIVGKYAYNNRKILMIGDSYMCTLLPFLSMTASDITTVDPRHFNPSRIPELINSSDFDIVMIAYNPTMFQDSVFKF